MLYLFGEEMSRKYLSSERKHLFIVIKIFSGTCAFADAVILVTMSEKPTGGEAGPSRTQIP